MKSHCRCVWAGRGPERTNPGRPCLRLPVLTSERPLYDGDALTKRTDGLKVTRGRRRPPPSADERIGVAALVDGDALDAPTAAAEAWTAAAAVASAGRNSEAGLSFDVSGFLLASDGGFSGF